MFGFVIYFAICVLKIFTLWLGLRIKMPIVLRIHNVIIISCLYVHIILKLVICITIFILRRSLRCLGL